MENDGIFRKWGLVLTVRFPFGIDRHPSVLDVVERNLGRICAIDTRDEGVRLSCGLDGESKQEAHTDASLVTNHVLSLLGLDNVAVAETRIAPRHYPQDLDSPLKLTVVPNDM